MNVQVRRVLDDPRFHELVARRNRFSWLLVGAMIAIYFGFILTIAFNPGALATPLVAGSVTTIGFPLGVGVIVSAVLLTGVYVYRANREFDALNRQILEASE